MMKLSKMLFVLNCLFILGACQSDDNINDSGIVDINDVENPNPNSPNINAATLEELGQLLFWDPILSGEMDISCATCHHPDLGYADARALSIGVGGVGLGQTRRDLGSNQIGFVKRNAPTIVNTAFNGMEQDGSYDPATAPMFWDNRMMSLEAQAIGPLLSFEEMRGHAFNETVALDSIINRLQANNQYQSLFTSAFGNANAISSDNIGKAIAAFERTIVATNSPFDRFQAGDQNAMTQQQIQGMNRFRQIGCDDCHSGPMFSDFELHVLGVPDNNQLTESDSGADGTYAFRTPTLRNLGLTAPYFHNGVGENLTQVLRFYNTARNPNGGGGNNGGLNINSNINNNQLDAELRDLGNINNNDIQAIIAFLEALDDPDFDRTIPPSVPSGLNPGGNID